MRSSCTASVAVAYIRGDSDAPALCGTVQFCQKSSGVLITARIFGLPESNDYGFFALHIHEGSSCSGENFSDTGSHYNPKDTPHPCHAGDLPPLLSCGGEAYLSVLTDRFALKDVIGRTVVIHSGPDDFHSQPAGNSGKKIGCGIICRKQH